MKSFTAVALGLLATTGCISLEEDTTTQPTPDKFFKEVVNYESFIAGAYTPMVSIYGSDMPYVAGGAAEDVYVPIVRWKGFETADINSVGNPDEVIEHLWKQCYSTIGICNTMLQIIGESTLDPKELDHVVGEAKFLRALGYFHMTRWFKEVPLILENNMVSVNDEPDASLKAIYDQIVADLKDAESKLPKAQVYKTRPTSLAATAMLSKVYLTMAGFPLNETSYYALARDKAKEIIDLEIFDLVPAYFDLWLWANRETNREFIFTFYAKADSGDGTYVNRGIRPGSAGEGGWEDWVSDSRYLDEFPVGDGSRVEGTFYLTLLDGSSWENTMLGQPFVGKLRDAGVNSGGYKGPWVSGGGNADGFWSVIRFSEVLLIYAEAANLAENGPSDDAYKAINRVRSRAGLGELSGLGKDAFDKAVLDERKWEFAFELHRWFDICRRQLLTEVMSEYYPERVVKPHNYWMPKPKAQLSIMKGSKQNDGY